MKTAVAPKSEPAARLKKVQRAMKRRGLDALIVFERNNAKYLTGFDSSLSFLLIAPHHARLLLDGRYIESARQKIAHCELEHFKSFRASFERWCKEFAPRKIGFEGSIEWDRWREFSNIAPRAEWVECKDLILGLRVVKSASEIKLIEASAQLNDEIYEYALTQASPGCTEIDLRNAIRGEADRHGAQSEAFDCIVATGANGSMPHYTPTDARLKRGDMLLIDMGMRVGGYCSDMTRVVSLGTGPKRKRMRRVFDAVLEAEQAAIDAVKPGAVAEDLHTIATNVLKKYRLAKYFTHGLGHGVGVEIHEAPSVRGGSKTELRPGMVITIEPGVYLPGVGGVRVEDLIVVTRSGKRVLSKARKDFRIIDF